MFKFQSTHFQSMVIERLSSEMSHCKNEEKRQQQLWQAEAALTTKQKLTEL